MTEPTVCAVMLTANRPEMARHAVECFRAQTYPNKRLLIVNTGPGPILPDEEHNIAEPCFIGADALTIGELRNMAMDSTDYRPHNTRKEADIICHWDDDDWSHPNRIAEQVALLQASGAEAVGYNSLLFWREPEQYIVNDQFGHDTGGRGVIPGEAWLYSGGITGTSLMYPRTSWQRKHFEPMNNGEDTRFLMGLKTAACPAIVDGVPRMIARIHPGNTSNAYNPDVMRAVERQGGEWRRVPEFDNHCRRAFA